MDPEALWADLFDALKTLEIFPDKIDIRTEVVNHLNNLGHWLTIGGAPPDVMQHCFNTMLAFESVVAEEEQRYRKRKGGC